MFIARQHLQAGLVFLLGLTLSLLAIYVAENHAKVKAEADFVQSANEHLSSIERIVSAELNVVKSIVGLYQSSASVDRKIFGPS